MSWVRSSFCSGGQCVEARFTRASGCTGGNCVEVAGPGEGGSGGNVLLRDGKLGDASPVLSFDRQAWADFLELVPTIR